MWVVVAVVAVVAVAVVVVVGFVRWDFPPPTFLYLLWCLCLYLDAWKSSPENATVVTACCNTLCSACVLGMSFLPVIASPKMHSPLRYLLLFGIIFNL